MISTCRINELSIRSCRCQSCKDSRSWPHHQQGPPGQEQRQRRRQPEGMESARDHDSESNEPHQSPSRHRVGARGLVARDSRRGCQGSCNNLNKGRGLHCVDVCWPTRGLIGQKYEKSRSCISERLVESKTKTMNNEKCQEKCQDGRLGAFLYSGPARTRNNKKQVRCDKLCASETSAKFVIRRDQAEGETPLTEFAHSGDSPRRPAFGEG